MLALGFASALFGNGRVSCLCARGRGPKRSIGLVNFERFWASASGLQLRRAVIAIPLTSNCYRSSGFQTAAEVAKFVAYASFVPPGS